MAECPRLRGGCFAARGRYPRQSGSVPGNLASAPLLEGGVLFIAGQRPAGRAPAATKLPHLT